MAPWFNRFDFKIAQKFKYMANDRIMGIEVSLDILNVGNLLNSDWGTYKYMAMRNYDNVSLLSFSGANSENIPTFKVNANSSDDFANKTDWTYSLSTGSTWGMQLGVKVTF